ncbi:MAG: ATP synthase F1 subunit delta [Clostridiales bacterium]|nr:ATP synthase F1 subunit delta [Clostridiales bacterium]
MASVGSKFARALFDACVEDDSLEESYGDAQAALASFEDPELSEFLSEPRIKDSEKLAVIAKAFAGASPEILGLASAMIRHRRQDELVIALKLFLELARDRLGIILIKVSSPAPLSERQRERLRALIEKPTGKKVEFVEVQDKALIGGLSVRANGLLIDATVKSKLEKLRKSLRAQGDTGVQGDTL